MDRNAVANPDYDAITDADPATSNVPYRVFNIGNNNPVQLLDFIGAIESALGMKAEKRRSPFRMATCRQPTPICRPVQRLAWFRSRNQR